MLRPSFVAGIFLASLCACGGNQPPSFARTTSAGGPGGRIQARSLSDRPPLAIIERQGDPESALAFASLSSGSPELHAAFGELLKQRLLRAGFQAQLVAHGLGFELLLLAERAERASAAAQALVRALQQPVTAIELGAERAALGAEPGAPTAVAQCSGELAGYRRATDPSELENERLASFARDRAALAVVGEEAAATAVADALSAGPDWPERGRVRSILPTQGGTQVRRGERALLSFALTLGDPNRALEAAADLGDPQAALNGRLLALGHGLRLLRVTATAHPTGACLRLDSDVDSSPLPDARHLGFAVQAMREEAELSLARTQGTRSLEASALSATDPRLAARAAAYSALLEPDADVPSVQLVALTTPDEAPLAPSIDAAIAQASTEAPSLDARVKVEAGQPGLWALLVTPCASVGERAQSAGHAAVWLSAAAAGASDGVRLEPWVGAQGMGILGFAERAPGESDAATAARLGNALGRALVTPPSAVDVASARTELLKTAGNEPRPLLEALLESLAPGHAGALMPRGNATSLQGASREAVLLRQRELLRVPHRLLILSPTNAEDAAFVTRSAGRWLKSPEPLRQSPCATEVSPPARGELSLAAGVVSPEDSYFAFRIGAKAGAEATVLAEVLSAPGGPLTRALAEPDLVGAARASVFGTAAARALVVQLSAFEGREAEAAQRIQRLLERLSTDGVLAAADIEAALSRQRAARRVAALDPRYRLMQLLEPHLAVPTDAAAVKRLAASLRPEAMVVARAAAR